MKGYRLLTHREEIKLDDEFLKDGTWQTVPERSYGYLYLRDQYVPFRRKEQGECTVTK
jgi:hypothetical protein